MNKKLATGLIGLIVIGMALIVGCSAAPQPTPTATLQPTPSPEPTVDLWQFYVDDVKKGVPNASITVETLKTIAAQIPADNPYFAEAEIGITPSQDTGKVISEAGPVSLNAPEGGYTYLSMGYGKVAAGAMKFDYEGADGNVYLVLVVGKPEDGTATDLKTSFELSDFPSGSVYTNFASPASGQALPEPIINQAWFAQQIWWAQSNKSITVSIVDLNTGDRLDYKVDPKSLAWKKN